MEIAASLGVPYTQLLATPDSADDTAQSQDNQSRTPKPTDVPLDSAANGARSTLQSVLRFRTPILLVTLGFLAAWWGHRPDHASTASKAASIPNQTSNILRLSCVDDKKSEISITLDFKNETVEYLGELFYTGRTEHDDKGKTYTYAVKFDSDDISFLKYTGKNIAYGGRLSRSTLIFRRYLGAGSFGDDEGVLNTVVMFAAATLSGMQCEVSRKRL